jgi:hypothetical protein
MQNRHVGHPLAAHQRVVRAAEEDFASLCLGRGAILGRNGAVEWIRTTTVLLPPAPQAGASASSATTARTELV